MNITDFIAPELLILIPVLYLLGMGIKRSEIADKYIPLLLGVVAVLLCGIYICSTTELNSVRAVATAVFSAITQGILCAGASVYANQLIKQTKEDK